MHVDSWTIWEGESQSTHAPDIWLVVFLCKFAKLQSAQDLMIKDTIWATQIDLHQQWQLFNTKEITSFVLRNPTAADLTSCGFKIYQK